MVGLVLVSHSRTLVEGAFLAGVQASVGASLDEVAAAAESAATMTKLPKD